MKPVFLGIAVFLSLLMLLFVYGCSKPAVEPVFVPQVAAAPVQVAPVVVAPAVVALPATVVVVKATPKKASRGTSKAEKAAYAKAYKNAALANHLLGRNKYRTHA